MTYAKAIRHAAVALFISTMWRWSASAHLASEGGDRVDTFVRPEMKRQMILGLSR